MSSQPIRVAITDDQRLFRGGLKMILGDCDDVEVIFEAKHGKQLLERLQFEPVDVIILDIEMPEMDGAATLSVLQREFPDIQVIMLTMHDSNRLIAHFMQEGASGFLLKDEEPEVVCQAVRQVANGQLFFRDYVSQALLKSGQYIRRGKGDGSVTPDLSDREMEVLRLLCAERTNKEIGEALFISGRTVEGHRRNLIEKTGARNLAGLVLFAVRHGLVE